MAAPIVSFHKWIGSVSYVEIPGARSFTVRSGRERLTDQYSAGSCVVTGVDPANVPQLTIGDLVKLDLDTTGGHSFRYRVVDYRVDYGPVEEMDTWTLTLEDHFGAMGRGITSEAFGAFTYTATSAAATIGNNYPGTFTQAVGGKTQVQPGDLENVNGLETFNQFVLSEQGRAYTDGFDTYVYGRDEYIQATQTNPAVYFSDDPADTTAIRYTALEFAGIADDYADKVIVSAFTLSDQVVGTGDYSYQIQTYLRDATDQTDCGYFLLAQLDLQNQNPTRISYFLDDGGDLITPLLPEPLYFDLTFRSSVYNGFIEGWILSGDVGSQLRVTLNLSAADTYNFFVLDDPVFGRLDYNKLGW